MRGRTSNPHGTGDNHPGRAAGVPAIVCCLSVGGDIRRVIPAEPLVQP